MKTVFPMIDVDMQSFLLVGSPEYSGSGKAMTYYAKLLTDCGCQTSVLSYSMPHDMRQWPDRYAGIRFLKCATKPVPFETSLYLGVDFSLVEAILSWIRQNQGRKIILWGHYLYPYGLAVLVASKLAQVSGSPNMRVWLTPAGSDIWNHDFRLPELSSRMLELTDNLKVVCYSPRFANETRRVFPQIREVHIVPPVIDDAHFFRKEKNIDGSLIIAVICNMRPWKGIDRIESTLNRLGLRRMNPLLLLVGPKRKGVGFTHYRTHWAGITSDTRRYYWRSHFTMNFSSHDSFNLALAESALCGTPFLTTDVAGILDYLDPMAGKLAFSLEDDVSLQEAGQLIAEMATEPILYQNLANKLHNRVSAEFGYSRRRNNFLKYLSKLAK